MTFQSSYYTVHVIIWFKFTEIIIFPYKDDLFMAPQFSSQPNNFVCQISN